MRGRCGGEAAFRQAIIDGEIEEVENPENPSGPLYYKVVTYRKTESTGQKKVIQTKKNKDTMDLEEAMDLDFDMVDLGWSFKGSNKALQNIASESSGTGQLAQANASANGQTNASSSGQAIALPNGPSTVAMAQAKPLPIEDMKERDKLMLKVEQALQGASFALLKAAKVVAHCPMNALGKRQRDSINEHMGIVKQKEAMLKHLVVYGSLPNATGPMELASLKELLKEFHEDFSTLRKATEMAAPLMKPDAPLAH
jgi:hypothetical protein